MIMARDLYEQMDDNGSGELVRRRRRGLGSFLAFSARSRRPDQGLEDAARSNDANNNASELECGQLSRDQISRSALLRVAWPRVLTNDGRRKDIFRR